MMIERGEKLIENNSDGFIVKIQEVVREPGLNGTSREVVSTKYIDRDRNNGIIRIREIKTPWFDIERARQTNRRLRAAQKNDRRSYLPPDRSYKTKAR